MQHTIIDKPPTNPSDWVKTPPNDIQSEFVESLAGLLRERTFNVIAEEIPIGWAVEAAKEAPIEDYKVMMQRIPVNFGELGTARGTLYFELRRAAINNNSEAGRV
jgi:hypothetical protein